MTKLQKGKSGLAQWLQSMYWEHMNGGKIESEEEAWLLIAEKVIENEKEMIESIVMEIIYGETFQMALANAKKVVDAATDSALKQTLGEYKKIEKTKDVEQGGIKEEGK